MTPSREPNPRLFVELLFEVVIYEFEYIRQDIDRIVLCKIFETFVKVSKEYQDTFACPCHDFIRDSDLLVEKGSAWSTFIYSFEPRLLPRFRPLRALEDHYFGYRITESGISVPAWSPILRRHFERRYDVFVPATWKDDVAVFIHYLRTSLSMQGSEGKLTWCFQGKVKGVRRFSSRGVNKNIPNGEKLVLFAQEQEAIQKQQVAIQDALRIQDEIIQISQEAILKRQQETAIQKQQEETIRKEQQRLTEKEMFLSFYYELVIFELAATCGMGAKVVPVERISDAFTLAVKVLEKNSSTMFPCSSFIQSQGLENPRQVVDFMKQHRPPWRITTTSTTTDAMVFEFVYNNRSRTEVVLPTLSGEDERAFLEAYDATVPSSLKDDLAILIWELQNRLTFRGSGGRVSTLRGGLQGVTKFTDMDATPKHVLEQHELERGQRLEKQQEERLELDRSQKQSRDPSGETPEEIQLQNTLKEEDVGEEDQLIPKEEEAELQTVRMEQEQHLSSEEQAQGSTHLEQEPCRDEEEATKEHEELQSQDSEIQASERLRLHYINRIRDRERENFFNLKGRAFHYPYRYS